MTVAILALVPASAQAQMMHGKLRCSKLAERSSTYIDAYNNKREVVCGRATSEQIYADAGDIVFAGRGHDTIEVAGSVAKVSRVYGEAGNDKIIFRGGTGQALLDGGTGNDRITGLGVMRITIRGGPGKDSLAGDAPHLLIEGGSGDDQISGGGEADRLRGQAGADTIWGSDGADIILGGAGNDSMFGGGGSDTIIGSSGHDELDAAGDDGSAETAESQNVLVGGPGRDWLLISIGQDHADGGDGNDSFNDASQKNMTVDAPDEMHGGPGNDKWYLTAGDNMIYAGGGDDVIMADQEQGSTTAYGEDGNDRMELGKGDDFIDGGGGNDSLMASYGSDRVLGGSGDDYIWGYDDRTYDMHDGGTGADLVFVELPLETAIASEGADLCQYSGWSVKWQSFAGYGTYACPEDGGLVPTWD